MSIRDRCRSPRLRTGVWYFSMLLTELDESASSDDGYAVRDWLNIPNPEYIGVPKPPAKVQAIEFYNPRAGSLFRRRQRAGNQRPRPGRARRVVEDRVPVLRLGRRGRGRRSRVPVLHSARAMAIRISFRPRSRNARKRAPSFRGSSRNRTPRSTSRCPTSTRARARAAKSPCIGCGTAGRTRITAIRRPRPSGTRCCPTDTSPRATDPNRWRCARRNDAGADAWEKTRGVGRLLRRIRRNPGGRRAGCAARIEIRSGRDHEEGIDSHALVAALRPSVAARAGRVRMGGGAARRRVDDALVHPRPRHAVELRRQDGAGAAGRLAARGRDRADRRLFQSPDRRRAPLRGRAVHRTATRRSSRRARFPRKSGARDVAVRDGQRRTHRHDARRHAARDRCGPRRWKPRRTPT